VIVGKVLASRFAIGLSVSAEETRDIIFCSYNLENFSQGKAPDQSSPRGTKPKDAEAIATQIRIICEISPDILGVCEMGSPAMFERFRSALKEGGVDLPHVEYVVAGDEDRRLALLSRYPMVARESKADLRFELNGREESVRRGILDVTVEVNAEYRLRCVGVHLKSRLPVPQGESLIRRFEAQKLREHLDRILAANPTTNLLCYGDFNDTRNEPMFQQVTGARGSRTFMTDLPCTDPLGDRWTHYWKTADQYSRIDYLFASVGLLPEVNPTGSRIYRSADWNLASDHRPVFAAIRPLER
jgi:endonuclease/exonuclease/phosphatase family metal-dependent hydrolase